MLDRSSGGRRFRISVEIQRRKSMSQIVVDLGTKKKQELSDGVDELIQAPEKTEREASIETKGKLGIGRPLLEWGKQALGLFGWFIPLTFVVLVIVAAFWQHSLGIAAIVVPKSLTDIGFTGEVAARRLRDALDDLQKRAAASLPGMDVRAVSDLPDITIPKTDLSFETVAAFVRGLFLPEHRRSDVTGEITESDSQLALRVRFNGHVVFKDTTTGPAGLDTLMDDASPELLEALYREMIQWRPASAVPHENFGNLLSYEKKLDEAAAEFLTAIRLDPTHATPHNNLGVVLHDQNKLDEAAAEFRTAIRLDSTGAAPHAGLGFVLYEQKKLDEAAAEFRTAIRLDSTGAAPHFGLAKVLRDQKKRDEADAESRAAIGLSGLAKTRPSNNAAELPTLLTPGTTEQDPQMPLGWFAAGSDPSAYEMGCDDRITNTGKCSGYLKSIRPSQGFGTLMQVFKADEYRSKRLRMTGFCKSSLVKEWAGLWMRVDGKKEELLGFDNMQNRPITGTTDWTKYQIVMDVSDASADIAFGALLVGDGWIWCDTFEFEIVDTNTPTTVAKDSAYPDHPLNLDFER